MATIIQNKYKITKDVVNKLELNPHTEGLSIDINYLEHILLHAIHLYYNTDKPLLRDNTYDILENIVRIKNPNSYIFDNIGAKISNTTDAIKLPYFMGSLDKVKPNEKSLSKWINKHNTDIVISEKLDGLSTLLVISLKSPIITPKVSESDNVHINKYTINNLQMNFLILPPCY